MNKEKAKRIQRKRHFTLIELLVVIAMLEFAGYGQISLEYAFPIIEPISEFPFVGPKIALSGQEL